LELIARKRMSFLSTDTTDEAEKEEDNGWPEEKELNPIPMQLYAILTEWTNHGASIDAARNDRLRQREMGPRLR
jgi:hypothetical protein